MRIAHCARIVAYNILGRKRHAFCVLVNILLITCALVIWLVLTASLRSAHDRYIYGTLSDNFESMTLSVAPNGQLIDDQNYERYRTLIGWEEIAPPVITAQPDLPRILERDDWIFVNNRFATLVMDGTSRPGLNDDSYDFHSETDQQLKQAIPFRLSVVYSDHAFSDNDLSEFAYWYPDEQWLLCGTDELNEQELLISDYMLSKFGLSGDPAQYIGKEVSFLIDGTTLLDSYRLVGVINSDLFRCSGLADMPQMFVQGNQQTSQLFQIETVTARLPIRSYDNITEVLDRLQEQGISVSYFSWLRAEYYYNINAIHLIIERLLSVFELLVLLAIMINLYRILAETADKKCTQYGMMRAIGMPIRSICLISYMELMCFLFLSIVLSMFLSYFSLSFIDRIIYGMIHVHLELSLKQYLTIGAGAFLGLLVVFVGINTVILFRYVRCKPVQLLRNRCFNALYREKHIRQRDVIRD